MKNLKFTIKDLVVISISTAIIFVQQMAFAVLPNIQLTTLLIVLYSKVLGFRKTTIIIIIHVIVYNILSIFGAINPAYLPFMIFAWMLIPILLSTVFKKVNSSLFLAIIGLVFGFVYGWILVIPAVFVTKSPFIPYLIADIPFEIMMAVSNFITIYLFYDRLNLVFRGLLDDFYQNESIID